jgi:hypothetical protein
MFDAPRQWWRNSPAMVIARITLVVPFAFMVVRLLGATGHIYLSGDLALIDLHVRDALHWQQSVGPYDRYVWDHPGPAYFYLQSLPARVLGSGSRAEFVGATLLNGVAAWLTVSVVCRRAGSRAALWTAVCLSFLGFALSVKDVAAPLGVPSSPWSAYVVIFPMVLFVALCTAAATGSALSLLGAVLVGSFAVQTDFSTFPLVAVVLGGALVAVVVRAATRRRRDSAHDQPPRRGPPWAVVPGIAVLVLMWVPPLVEQFSDHPGNLTRIWRFFTAHHPPGTLGNGLWSVLATNAFLDPWHQRNSYFEILGRHPQDATLTLVCVLAAGVAALVLGVTMRRPFAAVLGVVSLVGFGVMVVSLTRSVGPIFAYIALPGLALPIAALMGIGVALLPESPVRSPGLGEHIRRNAGTPLAGLRILSALAVVVTVLFCARIAHERPLTTTSSKDVAAMWHDVSAHLRPSRQPIYVAEKGPYNGLTVTAFNGLFDELQARGYHPRAAPSLLWLVGPQYISSGHERVKVLLYPPTEAVQGQPGYVGHTASANVVITPQSPS